MTAGYTGTPLSKKLGINPGFRVRFVNPPKGYDKTVGRLPATVSVASAARGTFDFVQIFADKQADLERRLPALKKAIAKDGMIWINWPKKASGVATDLSDSAVRKLGLSAGLVDIKTCAVDETWSGLKFVYRKKDR